jgi:hypothetical protein
MLSTVWGQRFSGAMRGPARCLRGDRVALVKRAAEAVAATDLVRRWPLGRWRLRERRTLLECSL